MLKPYLCKHCGTTEPSRFWGRAKSVCNRCKSAKNTPKYRKTAKGKATHNASNNAYAHNRRARIHGNGGTHTAAEWKALKEKYGNMCLRCKATNIRLTKDHVLPISLGGSNSIDNIQPLCLSCNSTKHDKHIDYR